MNKISFDKIEGNLIIRLNSTNRINLPSPSVVDSNVALRFSGNGNYELTIRDFFRRYSKIKSLEVKLIAQGNFVINYDYFHDSLKFSYSDTKDECELTKEIGYVSYGTGKETITEILIKNLSEFIEKRSEILTEKYLLNTEEKQIIDFYREKLGKYEASFSGDNKDKVSKARAYLDYMSKSFPLINESYAPKIKDFLKGMEFQELEECVESVTTLQGKTIRLEPLRMELPEDRTSEYLEKYRCPRTSLSEAFDESDIEEIPEIEETKITELKAQLPRVRRILEIRSKHAPPPKRQKIEQYITVIKNFERKEYYISEEDRVSTLRSLLDIFEGVEGVSTLIIGIPLVIIESIVKIIKSILALNDLKNKYTKEKKEKSWSMHTSYNRRERREERWKQEEQDYLPQPIPIKRLERQPEPVQVRDKRMIVEIVEAIIKKHGPRTVPEIKVIAKKYNYKLRGAQIEHAVYGSDKFYPSGRREIRYKGVLRDYKIYHLRRFR